MAVTVKRKSVVFSPDFKRVIARFFMPGDQIRAWSIIEKVMALSKSETRRALDCVLRLFAKRHRNITRVFESHFDNVESIFKQKLHDPDRLTREKRMLIGSYFTMEYSIESAAFFNPSIVEDTSQEDLGKGELRVVVSFRATGEGHISSLVFRNGIIDRNNDVIFQDVGSTVDAPEQIKRYEYFKATFLKNLGELNIPRSTVDRVLEKLPEKFIYGELQASLEQCLEDNTLTPDERRDIQAVNWLASSHYEITFSLDTDLSERVIFPISYAETKGIEDARFVRFIEDDGTATYYATYTAYNGRTILPKMIETKDFYHFSVRPLHGNCVRNKGLALFPKRIGGKFAMISRIDGINNHIMFSDMIHLWNSAKIIQEPIYPWEFIQVGNAGSPIETEKGWLMVTHGVGPMRRYCLGAVLLDLEDPTQVIGRMQEPLLAPSEDERNGYVPNVVYSCGSLIHNGELIIPYAMSDYSSGFASVSLDEIFDELEAP